MLQLFRYRGFCRLAVFVALVVSHWPSVLLELTDRGYGFRGVWRRFHGSRDSYPLAIHGVVNVSHSTIWHRY